MRPEGGAGGGDELSMKIDCDQVSFVLQALDDYANNLRHPKTAEFTCFMRMMEILGLEFEDDKAAGNALYHFPQFNEFRGLSPRKGAYDNPGIPLIRDHHE